MEQELTMEELIALINSQKSDFVIRVEFGEEAVSDAKDTSCMFTSTTICASISGLPISEDTAITSCTLEGRI